MTNPTQNSETRCAFLGCLEEVTDDDYCPGCSHYVCEKHSVIFVMGSHDVVEHWEEDD